jgi:hypothetical protein
VLVVTRRVTCIKRRAEVGVPLASLVCEESLDLGRRKHPVIVVVNVMITAGSNRHNFVFGIILDTLQSTDF